MSVTGAKLGIKCVAYYNTGSYGSPTWTAMTSILSVSVQAAWDKGDASARASIVKLIQKTMLDLGFELKVRADDTAADYLALWNSFVASTSLLDMVVLNGPINDTGSRGFRASCQVADGPEDQGEAAVVYDTFTLKPGLDPNGYPQSCVITAGSPVFSAIA